jgi:hypothetical protein
MPKKRDRVVIPAGRTSSIIVSNDFVYVTERDNFGPLSLVARTANDAESLSKALLKAAARIRKAHP